MTFITRVWKGVAAVVVTVTCLAAVPASAQVEIVVPPPPAFIATTPPVYFEGHPAYWYGNRWYFRDGAGWHFYHHEPGYLRGYRGRFHAERRFYEHGGGYRGGWRR